MHPCRIDHLAVLMLCRTNGDLILPAVQPCAPEAEGAVGADIRTAVAHQLTVEEVVRSPVPVHDGIFRSLKMLLQIGGIIREQVKCASGMRSRT